MTGSLFSMVVYGASRESRDAVALLVEKTPTDGDDPDGRGRFDLAAGELIRERSKGTAREVDWEAYAVSYDAVTRANPAYRSLVDRVSEELDKLRLAPDAIAADLGCGTGTFSELLLVRIPDGRVYALDKSQAFLDHLKVKFHDRAALRAAQFDMDSDEFPEGKIDVIVSVHVLCHSAAPGKVLGKVFQALKPGGAFVVADIGRPLILRDWSSYVAASLASEYGKRGWGPLGILPALSFLIRHRRAARENRNFQERQRLGLVWTHTLDEFVKALQGVGFEIRAADGSEFRGIDSFAVAIKPPDAAGKEA